MDAIGATYILLATTLVAGLWLVKGSGRSRRSRHVHVPLRYYLGLFFTLTGFHISLIALYFVLASKDIPADVPFLLFLAVGHLITLGLAFLGPGVHVRSGFRPVEVVCILAPGDGISRDTVLQHVRDRLNEARCAARARHPWACDLVAHTRRTFICNIFQFWTVTEAGGQIEVRALIDVEDYIIRDTKESVEVNETARQVAAWFQTPPFQSRLLEVEIRRLPDLRLLLGPGPEPQPGEEVQSAQPGRLERLGRYILHYKLTQPGKFLVGGLIASVSLGATSLRIPVYHLVTALFGFTALAFLAGWALRPRLRVAGSLPDRTSAGHPVSANFSITNRSLLPAFEVAAGFFHLPSSLRDNRGEAWISHVPRGRAAPLTVTLHPAKRGYYTLPPLVPFSTFPFNLFRFSATRHPSGSLLVLPAFHSLADINVPVGRRYQPGGVALTSSIGESPEYIGNREYRNGDPLRRVDWKSWARLARPTVREYQEEYYCRIALVLDTFIPRERREAPEGFPDLEAAISLTAATADALSRGEFLIDIFAAGPQLHVFRSGRNITHFDNVLEILACLDACRANPFDIVAPALAEQLGNISTVVCLLLDWDASRARLVRAAVEAGCAVKLIVVRDADTTESLASADAYTNDAVHLRPGDVLSGEVQML